MGTAPDALIYVELSIIVLVVRAWRRFMTVASV